MRYNARAQQDTTLQATTPDVPKLAAKPWVPTSAPTALKMTNATIIDATSDSIQRAATIFIQDGMISAISTSSHNTTPSTFPRYCQTVDLNHAYVCPGLIDTHVHLHATPSSYSLSSIFAASPTTLALRTTYTARSMLLRGFTTVRDTGGADDSLKNAIAEGLVPGPRLFTCGKAMSQSGGHMDAREPWEGESCSGSGDACCGSGSASGLGVAVDGVAACLTQARENIRRGANFLKIATSGGVASASDPLNMVQFTGEEIRAIVSVAESVGTYVTAHAYTPAAIRHAVENGVKGIEHANLIDVETARYLADNDVSVTPTLITYQAMTEGSFGDFLSETSKAKNSQILAAGLESLKILYDAGVQTCFGTDLLAGMHVLQSREFEIRGRVLPAAEVLRSATTTAAKRLGMEGKLGVMAVGALADLLVLTRNPLEDIGVLSKPSENILVLMKGGRVVTSCLKGLDVDPMYKGL